MSKIEIKQLSKDHPVTNTLSRTTNNKKKNTNFLHEKRKKEIKRKKYSSVLNK